MKILPLLLLFALYIPAYGQVMNDPTAAKRNAKWLTESVWAGDVTLPAGILYVDLDKPATTKATPGCLRINTKGSISYPETSGGNVSTIVQLGKGPVFNLPGNGAYCVEPFTICGDGKSAAIEVEGRANPASGCHRFENIAFYNWGTAFRAKGGEALSDDHHADMVKVNNCRFFKCGTVFRNENQQANGWTFRDCTVDVLDTGTCTLFDLVRPCELLCEHLLINHPRVVLFKLGHWSPNNCRLICRDFLYDRPTATDPLLRLVEYAGDPAATHYCDSKIEITGFAPRYASELRPHYFKVPENLPRTRWKIEVDTLPGEKP